MNSENRAMQIVLLGKTAASYPKARKIAEKRGMRLPPYPLLERYVLRAKRGGFVANELLAHPEKDGVFKKGRDIMDSMADLAIPASEVPPWAFGRRGIGLVVVPKDGEDGLEASKWRVWVHPQSIVVFNRMIQTSGQWVPGKPHTITGIPVAVSPKEFERLPEDMKRWLYRIAGEGVRPLVCGYEDDLVRLDGQYVDTYFGVRVDDAFAVAGIPIQP